MASIGIVVLSIALLAPLNPIVQIPFSNAALAEADDLCTTPSPEGEEGQGVVCISEGPLDNGEPGSGVARAYLEQVTGESLPPTITSGYDILSWCGTHRGKWYIYRYEGCKTWTLYAIVRDIRTGQILGGANFEITHFSWSASNILRFAETITVKRTSYWQRGALLWYDVGLACDGSCRLENSDPIYQMPGGVTQTGTYFLFSTISGVGSVGEGKTRFVITVGGAPGDVPRSLTMTDAPTVRCDKVSFSNGGFEGCVFKHYKPVAEWSVGGPYGDVATHIREAQAAGSPGAYGTLPLTRTTNSATRALNRSIACPSNFPVGPGQSCDEYPFASTLEGAASGGVWSAKAVNADQNNTHGGSLSAFYARERILHNDQFFVRITDSGTTCLCAPGDGTGGGGGGGGGSGAGTARLKNDYTRDGNSDIVAVRDDQLHRWYGVGGGAFTYAGTYGPGWTPYAASLTAVGDISGDGVGDLIAVRDDVLHRWFGNGSGGFNYAGTYGPGWTPYASTLAAPGDINRDGYSDLVAVRDDVLYRWYGGPGGSVTFAGTWGPGWNAYAATLTGVGDINRDGVGDLVAIRDDTLHRWFGDGSGGFTYAGTYGPGWSAYESSLTGMGDINRDGGGDLLAVRDDMLYRWYSDGAGGFYFVGTYGPGWTSYLPLH